MADDWAVHDVPDLRVSAHAKVNVLQIPARAVKRGRYKKASKSQSQSTSATSATSPHLQRAAADAHGDDRLPNTGTGQVGEDPHVGHSAVSLGAAKLVAQLCVQWTVELDMPEPLFVTSTGPGCAELCSTRRAEVAKQEAGTATVFRPSKNVVRKMFGSPTSRARDEMA